MRARPSFLKTLVVILALAALWLGAPQIGRLLTATHSTKPAPIIGLAVATSPAQPNAQRQPRPRLDPATLPANTVWTFKDGAATHTYAIAMNELYVPAGPTTKRLHTLPPAPDLDTLLAAAATLGAQTGVQPQLVLYPIDGRTHDEATRRIVTPKVHIETDNLAAVRAAATTLGLADWRTPDYAPGHAIARVEGDPSQPLRAAAKLASLSHVTSATPLLAAQHAKRAVTLPNDPLFAQQWHLLNSGQQSGTAGIDINVTPVWPTLKGNGVGIGIVDDSLQITHPDLAPNVAASGHYDWNGGDTNPAPDAADDNHGTSVAGLAAARGNNGIGVSGAAPEATLYGLRLIAAPETDEDDAEAMTWKNDVIQIKSSSWGPATYAWELGYAGTLWEDAVATGTTTGRNGLGTIYLFASGNGQADDEQGSKNAFAGNQHVIPVGAITNTGDVAYYSEGGAHLVVCAPGESLPGIVTTDRTGANGYNSGSSAEELSDPAYTKTFGGTSAATPLAAGVIALMLEANPNLGWRDVKEILLRSSTQLDPTSTDWITRSGGQPSLPAIKHHPFFGGGLINAQAATALATTWTPLGTETTITASTTSGYRSIPDAGAALIIPLTPASTSPVVRVEHVDITVNIVHTYRGDLEIKLTSPAGTVSTLASPTVSDDGNDYDQWTFSSVRHWGENSAGTWTLSVRDAYSGITGYVVSATLMVHGVEGPPPVITLQPQSTAAEQGSNVILSTASTDEDLAYQWSRDGSPLTGATSSTLNLSSITLAQAGSYTCTLTNTGGRATTDTAKVAIYSATNQTQTINTGATFTTTALTAGTIDSFQWFHDGEPLANSSRITGATTGTLVVSNVTTADNGTYTLEAMVDGNPLPTGSISLAVRPLPNVTAPGTQSIRLGSSAAITFISDGGTYTYRYSGLPQGIYYRSTTGALSGRPVTTGTYPVVLTATDAFGLVTNLNITLVVEPLPAALVGVFNGYVARDSVLNANLGGAITLTTTTSGQLTGRLTLGTTTYPFKGILDGAAGAPATATLLVARKGLSSLPLELTLPIDNTTATGTLNSSVAISAWRTPWSKTAPANAYVGTYTLALETATGSGWPAGYSTGSLTVGATGAVSWTLQPADGTPALKGSTTLSAAGALPLFAPAKTPAGSFVGYLTLPSSSTPNTSITGAATWLRAATTSTRYANANGFGPVNLTPHGGRYTAPAVGTVPLGLPATTNNATLEFGGTDVDLGAQAASLTPLTLTLTTANKVMLPVTNPTALKLTVKPATGQFSGSFTLADSIADKTVKRVEKFSGVFLPQEGVGAGFFVLPALPGSSNGTRSGSVLLIEAP